MAYRIQIRRKQDQEIQEGHEYVRQENREEMRKGSWMQSGVWEKTHLLP